MRHFKRSLALLLALTMALLCGCAGTADGSAASEEKYTKTVFAMDTVMDITPYGPNAEAAADAAAKRISELEALFSVTLEDSDISAVNHAAGEPVQVSEETATLVSEALTYCEATRGALDISVYPVLRAWGFTTQEYRVPGAEELTELLSKVDYAKVRCDGFAVTVPDGMEIDLGSVAKGYTGDEIMRVFRQNGVTSGLVSLGGNVQALGAKPDGSPWRVAVQDPLGEGFVGVLEIADEAVVTSGGYERYFEQDGEVYWHIIDPATGAPAKNGVISATIVSDSGLRCDALSTALFILGEDAAADYWRAHGDFDYLLVLDNGSIVISEGIADRFAVDDHWADSPLTVVTK